MIDLSSHLIQSLIVVGSLTMILGYIAHHVVTTDEPQKNPVTETPDTDHYYQPPDDWSEDTALRWCSDCGAFNHTEYRFCRGCAEEIHNERMIHPRSISRLQQDVQNKH